MAESQRSHLLELPAELRSRIHELVLLHGSTRTMAPANGDRGEEICVDVDVLINGQWRQGHLARGSTSTLEGEAAATELAGGGIYFPSRGTDVDRFSYITSDAAVSASGIRHDYEGHICSYTCMLQPGLTRTNRQLQAETLGRFYSSNIFRVQLNDPLGNGPDQRLNADSRRVLKWWRSIGDTNLRSMICLHIDMGPIYSFLAAMKPTGDVEAIMMMMMEGGDNYELQQGVWKAPRSFVDGGDEELNDPWRNAPGRREYLR